MKTWILFGCIGLIASQAMGQGAGGVNREVISLKGQIEGAQGNRLAVKSDDGQSYLVQAPEDPEHVRFSGTGVPAMLRPGLFVRFEAVFDVKSGRGAVPVSNLEVFNPTPPKHAQEKDLIDFRPGLYPSNGGGGGAGLFADGGEKGVRNRPQVQTASFRVIGQVVGITKKGVLTVNCGKPVMVEVSPTAQIAVSDLGWGMAQPGDAVQLDGFYFPPNNNQVFAQNIRITSANPIGVPVEKPKPQRPVKGDKGAKGAEAKEGAGAKGNAEGAAKAE